MAQERSRVFGVVQGAAFTVAGLADVAYGQALHVLGGILSAMGRSPAPGVAREGHGGLQARGSMVVRRWTTVPDHHMEVMARRVARAAKDSEDG